MGKITGQEYVQYLTEQFVEYIEKPSNERKELKKSANAQKEQWLTRWFGIGGTSLLIWMRKRQSSKDV